MTKIPEEKRIQRTNFWKGGILAEMMMGSGTVMTPKSVLSFVR